MKINVAQDESKRCGHGKWGMRSCVLPIRTAHLQSFRSHTRATQDSAATMTFSKAEYQKEEFVAGMPPVPEGEFCVFGIVRSHTGLA